MKIREEKKECNYNFKKSLKIFEGACFNIHKNNYNEIRNKEQNYAYKINDEKIALNENKKRLNYIINKKLYFIKEFNILCYIILNIISSSFSQDNIRLKYSLITLKINKTGNISIFGKTSLCKYYYAPFPDEIYINENNQSELNSTYYLNDTENIIKLIWKSDITRTGCMFHSCSDITEINFSDFDSSHVTNMEYMFYGCSSLSSVDFSNFNSSLVSSMIYMFYGCSSLASVDLSNFNNNVVLSMAYMFYGCSSLTSIDLSNFKGKLISLMSYMFHSCSSLISIDLSNFNNNLVSSISYMFYGCSNLIFVNLSNFNTLKPLTMDYLFSGCSKLISIDFSFFDTSKVIDMSSIFRGCSSLISFDLSHIDTSNVESMEYMFYGCSKLNSLDLTNFNTSKVKDMSFMFSQCKNLTNLILSSFNTLNVEIMQNMFSGCTSLNQLNLSSFNTENVKDMRYMFSRCTSLISLDLTNFDTSEVVEMMDMFRDCSNLNFLDISSFNTSKVQDMYQMFYGCSSLTSINLYNFDTSKVQKMDYMFYGCSNLISINLSNFDTSNVERMDYMFYGCSNLPSLNLSNFNISKVTHLDYMFFKCSKLNYLNLKNAKIQSSTTIKRIFYSTSENLVVCSIDETWKNILSNYYSFLNCIDIVDNNNYEFNCYKSHSNINIQFNNTDICQNCGNNYYKIFNNLYDNDSFVNCYSSPEGYYLDGNNVFQKICYLSCKSCDINGNETHNNCIECKDDYFYELILNGYKNCYNDCLLYHYYDEENIKHFCTQDMNCPDKYNKLIFDKNECIDECSKDSIYKYEFNNSCYKECPQNTKNNSFYCEEILNEQTTTDFVNSYDLTEDSSNDISNESDNTLYNSNSIQNSYGSIISNDISQNSFISESNEKITDFPSNYQNLEDISQNFSDEVNATNIISNSYYTFNTKDINQNSNNYELSDTSDIINKNKTELIISIIEKLINNYNNSNNLDDTLFYNIFISLASSEILKSDKNKNKSSINLGKCEYNLKNEYNISYNDSLYILKIEIYKEGMKIPKIEYEVYYPLYNQNLIKLNLSICKNEKIDLSIPVKITEDIDKYNSSSGYYNDLCYKSTSQYGTDIIISDRREEYIYNNMTLCEENCELVGYDYISEKAKCSCSVKINLPLFENIYFDKNRLKQNFMDINNIANLNLIKCIKNVFNKSLKKNSGFFILIFIYILYFICLVAFYCTFNIFIKNKLNKIVKAKIEVDKSNKNKKDLFSKKEPNIKYINIYKKNEIYKTKDILKIEENREIKISINSNSNTHFPPKKNILTKMRGRNLNTDNLHQINNFFSTKYNMNGSNSKAIILSSVSDKSEKKCSINEEILEYNDKELNSLSYKDALLKDHRTFIQYYLSLLRYGNLFMFSFVNNKDYNPRIIKMFLFFLFFAVHFTINAFFFNDNTMHDIYQSKGKFDFIYQIPQILYSSLISLAINILIKYLSLSEDKILHLKHMNSIGDDIHIQANKIIRTLKIKFSLFFIITFFLLFIFWIYMTCFCGIYVNTQGYLIKDSIMSFLLSLLSPFIKYLIPGIFRIPALRSKEGNKSYLYGLSKIIQII